MEDICIICFQIGANINEVGQKDNTALLSAAETGESKRAELLVKAGASGKPDNHEYDNAYTALVFAITNNNHENCVAALIKAGANVNAMLNGYQVTFETKLDERGFSIGLPALQYAAENKDKHYKCLQLLIEAGADVNRVSFDTFTALIQAAHHESEKCVDLLLKSGADVNIANSHGYTALLYAVTQCSFACVNSLIQAGTDVNAVHKEGYLVLNFAVCSGDANKVRAILKAESHINRTSVYMYNSLMHLLSPGATPTAREKRQELAPLLFAAGEIVNYV